MEPALEKTTSSPGGDETAESLRKKAKFRSLFWPGAGFALLGYPRIAWIGLVIFVGFLIGLTWFALTLDLVGAWLALGMLTSGIIYWIAEYIAIGHVKISSVPKGLLSRFVPVCAVGAAVLGASLLVLFLNIGTSRIKGMAMSPTVLDGERVLYKKGISQGEPERGRLIVCRNPSDSAWEQKDGLLVVRILAVPGDRLSIGTNRRYLLNGAESVSVCAIGRFRPVLEVPVSPAEITVPPDCYFVVSDNSQDGFDSQFFNWVRSSDIIGTKLILLSGSRGFGKSL